MIALASGGRKPHGSEFDFTAVEPFPNLEEEHLALRQRDGKVVAGLDERRVAKG